MVLAAACVAAPAASAQELIYKWFGDQPQEYFGLGLAAMGDLTGDGIPDVVVGAPVANSSNGQVTAFSGADGSIAWTLIGGTYEVLGLSMESAGDIDGDAIDDLFCKSENPPSGNPGGWGVTLYSGATRAPLYTILGSTNQNLGALIESMGDVDGDGLGDVALTEWAAQHVFVVSGATGGLIYTILKPGDASFFGQSLASGGDVDGDGIADLVIGDASAVPTGIQLGAAWVHSGKTGALLYELKGLQVDSDFGEAVAIVDDLNQDGRSDVVVSTPNEHLSGHPYGRVRVFSGKSGSPLFNIAAPSGNFNYSSDFGKVLASAGDMDHDGFGDFLAYEGSGEIGGIGSSEVHLFSGRDGRRNYHYFAPDNLHRSFGEAMDLARDLDGDGSPEVALSDYLEDDGSGTNPGSASLWRGDDLFVDAEPRICVWFTKSITVKVGQGVAGAPYALFLVDVNGAPVNIAVAVGVFDANGRAQLTTWVPAGLRGDSFGLKAFALDANSRIIDSGVETVSFW
jgi:hypothetical protein